MWRTAGNTGALGIELWIYLGGGYWLGEFLDTKYDTAPWFLYGLFGLGVACSINALVRVTRQYRKQSKQSDSQKSDPPA